MGAGVKSCRVSGITQSALEHRSCRALAVGSGKMDEFQIAIGVSGELFQLTHPLKSEPDTEHIKLRNIFFGIKHFQRTALLRQGAHAGMESG